MFLYLVSFIACICNYSL